MKKLFCCILSLFCLLSSCAHKNAQYETMTDLMLDRYEYIRPIYLDRYIYSYSEVKEHSSAILCLQSADEMTMERNSADGKTSIRRVDVVEVFRDFENPPTEIRIEEECSLRAKNDLLNWENCYPMEKGEYYLFFLEPAVDGSGTYFSVNMD